MLELKRITPVFNHILVTKDLYEKDVTSNGVVIATKGTVKNYQKVVAIGQTVKICKPGDMVMIDPIRYAKMKHESGSLKDGVVTDNPVVAYSVPEVKVDGKDYMYLYDSDIQFVINDYKEIEDLPPLWTPSNTIIQ
jgi:co-chaperonin GroES (HSP10)